MTVSQQQDLSGVPGFSETLKAHDLTLTRTRTEVLQVNLGRLCNQACKHCHLSAGPDRKEIMSLATIKEVMAYFEDSNIPALDITGGAPEMNPHLPDLIDMAGKLDRTLMLRCNLSALYEGNDQRLKDLMVVRRVHVVASLPALNPGQTDAQRGRGSFDTSIEALQMLNKMGYADPSTGLRLDLVANPAGAFMPSPQAATEKRFRRILEDKWDIRFTHLFTFANMPLGRFRQWLERTGNYDRYLAMLHKGFNPCTTEGLMCRNLISVSWDGFLYDCDFNQAAGLPLGREEIHIRDALEKEFSGRAIAVDTHCYACTAGAGFT